MVLPEPFTTAPPVIATFSFTDIADGTGVQTFFGLNTFPDGAPTNEYFLSQSADYSEDESIVQHDVDFDLTSFNTPRDVTGTATLLCSPGMSGGGTAFFTTQLLKWDGTTETAISSAIKSHTYPSERRILLEIPLTDTHFNTGDVLRLNIKTQDVTGSKMFISATQSIKLNVPFKLNL